MECDAKGKEESLDVISRILLRAVVIPARFKRESRTWIASAMGKYLADFWTPD